MKAKMDTTSYIREELPQVVEATHNALNFQGLLMALEVYVATIQHLSDHDFRRWMLDSKGYFSLDKQHP